MRYAFCWPLLFVIATAAALGGSRRRLEDFVGENVDRIVKHEPKRPPCREHAVKPPDDREFENHKQVIIIIIIVSLTKSKRT